MNERIKELAIMANPSSKEIYEADNWQYNCAAWDSNNLTKFAELIVRECMRMCDVAAVGYETHGHTKEANGCYSAKEYIEEHFGVE
jgi:hypothetical protein